MKTAMGVGRIRIDQKVAGLIAIVTVLLFTQPGLAGGGEHR
jgi:hypothetical protein